MGFFTPCPWPRGQEIGYKPATDLKWDGQDVWPAISGKATKPAPRTIYIPVKGGAAVRNGDWKLIDYNAANPSELFNLAKDPYEKNNLAGTETKKLKELETLLEALRKNDVTTLPEDLRGLPQ